MQEPSRAFRVLHVASFAGNIGDNISHMGLRELLGVVLGADYVEERLEIRRTYLNYSLPDKLLLDDSFSTLCNSYDVVVFGGGNLLEPFRGSPSGTRLSFERSALAAVTVPILFASVGMIPRTPLGEDPVTAQKHKESMEFFADKRGLDVILRNDGTPGWFNENYPLFSSRFCAGLDAGFFAPLRSEVGNVASKTDSSRVAINLSLDQMESAATPAFTYDTMLEVVGSRVVARLESSDDMFIFVPHVHHDLQAFSDLMRVIPDYYARSRFSVASLAPGQQGAREALGTYLSAREAWSMRFHSVVAATVSETPVIPLVVSDRMSSLLDSIGHQGDRVELYQPVQLSERPDPFRTVKSSESLESMKRETADRYQQSLLKSLSSSG